MMARVATRIHDDELDTGVATARALLLDQCPQWADFALSYLDTSGTDNAMWRVHVPFGDDVVVRLPRRATTADHVAQEIAILRSIPSGPLAAVVNTPNVLHQGSPTSEFPHLWAVLGWLNGTDAWTARASLDMESDDLAVDLAEAIRIIGGLTQAQAPLRERGERGGPIGSLLERLDRWLDDPRWNAAELIDVAAVRRVADRTREISGEGVTIGFVHGDLIPGNLLVTGTRLAAIIDWGAAGYADIAQDLTPAWAVFDDRSRRVFRNAMAADDASWSRARAFALEQAVGGVLYYTPRQHPLGEVMARTLHRIVNEE
jgi:aminoglycoside phosphotransferase (APT) family kinase protein